MLCSAVLQQPDCNYANSFAIYFIEDRGPIVL